eukprot:TRINITY_DN51390_c0_g1_i1.p1 TRINITY_DN51390_c0_g1~~TRINITY_DN51390_c0_g1_i1.p1  ORF type:complete len:210 (+),score=62.71 TRINITY_DN51390_c0_g1_i1:94-723(+)
MPGMLVIVRHGETDGNAQKVMQPNAMPLNERGQQQAQAAAQRLAAEHNIGAVMHSTLRRAEMTAEAIAQSCGAPLQRNELLHERDYGELKGKPYSSLDHSPHIEGYHPPAGETWEVFRARCRAAWDSMLEASRAHLPERDFCVVTHGLVLFVWEEAGFLGSPPAELRRGVKGWGNTAVTILDPSQPGAAPVAYNCTKHLDAAGQPLAAL